MKLKVVGLICIECGEHVGTQYRASDTEGCWMGHVRHFHCYVCKRGYLLLFDEQRRFVSVLIGPFPWADLRSAGMTEYEPRDGDIPF